MREFVMRQKKKVCLMHCIGCGDIKRWLRNVAWHWEIYLPKRAIFLPHLLKPWQPQLAFSQRQDLSNNLWGCSRSLIVWHPLIHSVYYVFKESERLHTQEQACSHQYTKARHSAVVGSACRSQRTGVLVEVPPLPCVFDCRRPVLGR